MDILVYPLARRETGMTMTIIHGKPSTYNNHKCRCKECREAWNAYIAPRMKKYRETHGRTSVVSKPTPNNQKTRKADRYVALVAQQKSTCPICLRKPEKFDEDHNHETGEIRGLLCRTCNTGLGKLGDNPAQLKRAISYLENPPFRKIGVQVHL